MSVLRKRLSAHAAGLLLGQENATNLGHWLASGAGARIVFAQKLCSERKLGTRFEGSFVQHVGGYA